MGDNTNIEKLEDTNAEPMTQLEEGPENNPDWAHDALAELEEWIESQGIYIRQ